MLRITIDEVARMLKDNVTLIQRKEKQLAELCIGNKFTINGITFILLKKDGDRVIAIAKDIFRESKFSESCNNHKIKGTCNPSHKALFSFYDAVTKGNCVGCYMYDRDVSLKADNGSEAYGNMTQRTSLLTLDEYKEYRHLIPNTGKWWLATPHGTSDTNSSTNVCYIDEHGNVEHCAYDEALGIRPTMIFQKTLFVEIEEVLAISDIVILN